jgi:hypothetical protein
MDSHGLDVRTWGVKTCLGLCWKIEILRSKKTFEKKIIFKLFPKVHFGISFRAKILKKYFLRF